MKLDHGLERRRFLRTSGFVASILYAGGCLHDEEADLDDGRAGFEVGETLDYEGAWPIYGFDLSNETYVEDADGFMSEPDLGWSYETDGSITASPSIVDGTVYVGDKGESGGSGAMHAVDAYTGEPVWRYDETDSIESSPALYGDKLYFGDRDGVLHAVDATSGNRIWTFETQGVIRSSPVPYDDTVYIGSWDGRLYAVDADSGEEVWRFYTTGVIFSTPAIHDDHVYFGSEDGRLYSVEAESGDAAWSRWTGNPIGCSPAVSGGSVYFGDRDAGNGGVDRDQEGEEDGAFYSVDAGSGEVEWQSDAVVNASSPAVADDVVVVGDSDTGEMKAFDTESGDIEWIYDTGASVYASSPSIVGSSVQCGNVDGDLHCLDVDSGELLWRKESSGRLELRSIPAFYDDRLYYGTGAGELHMLHRRD